VVINLKQKPVSAILNQVCGRLRIAYMVSDGWLMVDSRTRVLEQRVEQLDRKLDQVLER